MSRKWHSFNSTVLNTSGASVPSPSARWAHRAYTRHANAGTQVCARGAGTRAARRRKVALQADDLAVVGAAVGVRAEPRIDALAVEDVAARQPAAAVAVREGLEADRARLWRIGHAGEERRPPREGGRALLERRGRQRLRLHRVGEAEQRVVVLGRDVAVLHAEGV